MFVPGRDEQPVSQRLPHPESQHLLAHELAHVKQQNGGAPLSMKPKQNADLEIDPDPKLEQEADQAAKDALADGPVTINRMGTDVHIQRAAADSEFVTKGEVLEIVDNYYTGLVEDQANQDPTDAGPERETPGGTVDKSATEDDGGFFSNAWEKTKDVGSDLSQAMTKGAIGSLAGAGGKLAGMAGGATLGAFLGGAVGSLAGPAGTALGVAAGSKIGETVGGEMVGGAASDVAKEVTGYAISDEHAGSVKDLKQKYESLKQDVEELKKDTYSTNGSTVEAEQMYS